MHIVSDAAVAALRHALAGDRAQVTADLIGAASALLSEVDYPAPVTVPVVCSGEYSDWRVHAAFTNEAAAEAVVATMKAADIMDDVWEDDPEVQHRVLYPAAPDPVEVLTLTALVNLDGSSSDTVESVTRVWPWSWRVPGPDNRPAGRTYQALAYGPDVIRVEECGVDHPAVRRAFADRKARALAEGLVAVPADERLPRR